MWFTDFRMVMMSTYFKRPATVRAGHMGGYEWRLEIVLDAYPGNK